MKTIKLYRSVNQKEFDLIKESGFTKFPPRLPEQPYFYPVTSLYYVRKLNGWNIKSYGVGYILTFDISKVYMTNFEEHNVGGKWITEYWIPSGDLEDFNKHIIGKIRLVKLVQDLKQCPYCGYDWGSGPNYVNVSNYKNETDMRYTCSDCGCTWKLDGYIEI